MRSVPLWLETSSSKAGIGMCFPRKGPVHPPPPFGAHVCIRFYFMFILLSITCGSSLILRITFISAYRTK